MAERQAAGRPIEMMDAFIAATARIIGLTVVTRNGVDFAGLAVQVFNPWTHS